MHDESTVEIEGTNEEEAVQRACDALNTRIENLSYEVVTSSRKKGWMGIVGGNKKFKIRAWRKDVAGEPCESGALAAAKEAMQEMLKHIDPEISVSAIEQAETIMVCLDGDDVALMIGKQGSTLDALQHILRKIVAIKAPDNEKRVVVNAEGYRERRQRNLVLMARKMASKVRETGRPQSLRPMNAFERRIVHVELQEERGVETQSEGEGDERYIRILPKGRAAKSSSGSR